MTMPRWQRSYLVACAGVIGFAIAYVASDFAPFRRLTYFPEERRWELLERPPNPVPMNYYGTLLWGLGGALAAAAAAYVLSRVINRPCSDRWLQLAGGWALTAVSLGCCYFLWNVWPF
jgi:hypothetical protein